MYRDVNTPSATSDFLEQAFLGVLEGQPSSAESMIIHNHLAQMRLFMLRSGLKFYPIQDSPEESRKRWLDSLLKQCRLLLYLPRMVDLFLCRGQICLYLKPIGNSYRVLWFSKEHHKAYYDNNGDLEKVVVCYPYEDARPDPLAPDLHKQIWVRLIITKDTVRYAERESLAETSGYLEDKYGDTPLPNEQTFENSLGFLPCVICKNYDPGPGQEGRGEFDWIQEQLATHNRMLRNINDNLHFFGNPTLITTRSLQDMLTTDEELERPRATIASRSGFASRGHPATPDYQAYVDDFRQSGGAKIRRIIANIEGGERVGYITPDAVSGDHNRYQAEYREGLRVALGGVDEVSISAGATAFEIKSVFGRAAATAKRKAEALFTYGVCELLSMAIYAEENIYRIQLARAIVEDSKLPKKLKLASEQVKALKFMFEASAEELKQEQLDPQVVANDFVTDDMIAFLTEEGMLPNITAGLMPFGDRTIAWQWTGPVFEDSPRDKLNLSIISRNMREDGINTIETLRFQYPDKTDKEIEAMLGSYPFRVANQMMSSIQGILGLQQQLLNPQNPLNFVPSPSNPQISYGQSLAAQLDEVINANFSSLRQELSHGPKYDPADPALAPAIGDYITDATSPAAAVPARSASAELFLSGQPQQPGSGNDEPGSGSGGIPGVQQQPPGPGTGPYLLSNAGGSGNAAPVSAPVSASAPGATAVSGYPSSGTVSGPIPTVPATGAIPAGAQLPFSSIPGGTVGMGAGGQLGAPNAVYPGQPTSAPDQQPIPDWRVAIPYPGSTVAAKPTPVQPGGIQPGTAANQPGIFGQLFPTFTAAANAVAGAVTNRARGRGKRKKGS
jgi:hypothetical protein